MTSKLPKITQVLELCLCKPERRTLTSKQQELTSDSILVYSADARSLPKSIEFYSKVLDLGNPSFSSDRLAVFPLAQTTLIIFQRGSTHKDSTLPNELGTIPGHGLLPPPENDKVDLKTHFALAVEKKEEVDLWEERFREEKIDVLGKVEWPGGGKSVYFRDPDGHVGEIASRGIWPHY
jgi:catechol 2,3-dioxygenase-like lactoylglutathione lyase family enzyme